MPRLRAQLLGAHAVFGADGERVDFPSGKAFALLVYLLLHPGPCTRDQLGRVFWPAATRERRQQSVRQALWLIRRLLGDGVLQGDDAIVVAADLLGSDVAELRTAARAGDAERIETLWAGRLLEHFVIPGLAEWDAWLEEEASRLERLAAAALHADAVQLADSADAATVNLALRRLGLAAAIEPHRLQHRLAQLDLLLGRGRLAEAEHVLAAARQALPEPEVAHELDARAAHLAELRRSPVQDPVALLSRPEFVGRARELSQLASAWNAARRGRTRRAVLSGEPGAGKTRLAEELARIVERDGGRVVVARTTPPEHDLQWSGMATLVRRLLTLPGAGGTSAASEYVLHRLVPSLARHGGASASQLPDATPLADAVADLIGAVSFEAPLLLVLDDVQWLDPSSWALLSRLMTQLEAEPVLFVLTVRDGEAQPSVQRNLARMDRQDGALAMAVTRFTLAEVIEFLAYNAGLGDVAREHGLAARMHRVTGGNPLFLVECLKAFRDAGALNWTDGRWVLDAHRVPDPLPLPSTIQGLLTRRLADLSAPARRVAESMAADRRSSTYETLREATQLRDAQLATALTELVRRGLIVETADGYALVHDQVAKAVQDLGRSASGSWRRPRMMAAAALVTLLLMAGVVYSVRGPAEPLYGGGSVFIVVSDSVVEWTPPLKDGGSWVRASVRARPAVETLSVHLRRTTAERLVWFAQVGESATSPYPVELLAGGEIRAYERHDRFDVGFEDLSPDGAWVLYHRDDVATPSDYDLKLHLVRRDGTDRRQLSPRTMSRGRFSPDGVLIAAIASGATDTLLVLRRDGTAVLEYDLGRRGEAIAWCGDSTLAAIGTVGGSLALLRVGLDGSGQVVAVPALSANVACAPDGRHVLATIAVDGLATLAVVDMFTGAHHPVPFSGLTHPTDWLRPRVAAVPQRLELTGKTDLRLGEGMQVEAHVVFSDGTRTPATAELRSLQPSVLTVVPGSRVIGNTAGETVLIGEWGGWLTDSLRITVLRTSDSSLLLADDFDTIAGSAWHLVGDPVPAADSYQGGAVLRLRGDGNFIDGLWSRRTFNSAEGLTLELEFRHVLTRRQMQSLLVTLCDLGKGLSDAALEQLIPEAATIRGPAFRYPAFELSKFDPHEIAFGYRSPEIVDLSGDLPTPGWTHAALQIQPDGFASLAVNRRRVATTELRLPDHADVEWRVCIHGSARDTESMVRGLRIWQGVRY